MKTGKKIALLFGVATGAAVALMAFGKTGKKTKNLTSKKKTEIQNLGDDSDINYV